nr:hypothetical protein [Dehalococcoidia bacterium]
MTNRRILIRQQSQGKKAFVTSKPISVQIFTAFDILRSFSRYTGFNMCGLSGILYKRAGSEGSFHVGNDLVMMLEPMTHRGKDS